jgi:hypothetical protein
MGRTPDEIFALAQPEKAVSATKGAKGKPKKQFPNPV